MSLLAARPASTVAPTLSPAALLGIARDLAADRDRLLDLVEHTPDQRWFTRLSVADDHDVWLIGWDSYQGVDLHDHGGSCGALYVVEGELLETSTRKGGGVFLQQQQLVAGTARAFGAGHVHRVVNPAAAVATSVHVYSPPLVAMEFFTADHGSLASTHTESAFGARSGPAELR
jgi:hypothetical protein